MSNSAFLNIIEGTRLSDNLVGTTEDDILIGYEGADNFDGGAGYDTVSYGYLDTGIRLAIHNPIISTGDAKGDQYSDVEAIQLTEGHDRYINSTATENYTVFAGQGNDVLSGGDQGEYLAGEAGDDEIHGMHGNDTLIGGAGSDDLRGYGDHDILIGGAGNDTLSGGAGIDYLAGGRRTGYICFPPQ